MLRWKKHLPPSVTKVAGEGDAYVRLIDRIIPMAGLRARGFEHAQIGPKDGDDFVHCDYLLGAGASVTYPLADIVYGNVFLNAVSCGMISS